MPTTHTGYSRPHYRMAWGRHRLTMGSRTLVMGIVNVTPDSFSDGGDFFDPDRAIAQGVQLAAEGADILDVGGESTRPFSDPVTEAEEIRRVVPVIEALSAKVSIPISVDTAKAGVARRALDAGAAIVNDVSALRVDPEMGALVAERQVPLVLMHMLGTPKTMQVDPTYDDVVKDVRSFLAGRIEVAVEQGIDRRRLIVDPGIGFGKTVEHNLLLVKCLSALHELDVPVMIGHSRKAFIRNLLKPGDAQDISPKLQRVEIGTQAVTAAAVIGGAHIVRVHHVANTRSTVDIIDALARAGSTQSVNGDG